MKAVKANRRIYLIFGVVVAAALLVLFVLPSIQAPIDNNGQSGNTQSKQYYSKLMKFWMEVPQDFGVDDQGVSLVLSKGDKTIVVDRNGTNYESLDKYMAFFDSTRNLKVIESEKVEIDNKEAFIRIEAFPNQSITEKSYFIYNNGVVYIFSTQSESLYADLDQIAQSFRYVP